MGRHDDSGDRPGGGGLRDVVRRRQGKRGPDEGRGARHHRHEVHGLQDFAAGQPFDTAAETRQDGLITMVLEITKNEQNLEIFFEDVLVVQVNPGSSLSVDELEDEEEYIPTYKYDPDSRDASLILPAALS
eukprot:2291250-Rhodomonas_salina.1